MAKHTTYRGQTIDIDMMKYQNQHDRALGNASMNARGDKLGQGGTIIKTREEMLAERERQMQLPDYIPEHTGHQIQVQSSSDGFDDTMFEVPHQEPAPEQPAPQEKTPPRRVRTKKDAE